MEITFWLLEAAGPLCYYFVLLSLFLQSGRENARGQARWTPTTAAKHRPRPRSPQPRPVADGRGRPSSHLGSRAAVSRRSLGEVEGGGVIPCCFLSFLPDPSSDSLNHDKPQFPPHLPPVKMDRCISQFETLTASFGHRRAELAFLGRDPRFSSQGGSPLPSHWVGFFSMSFNQSDLHSHGVRERVEVRERSSQGREGDACLLGG